ncbi:PPOX class F420-dependent oxidoreductase [Natronococcus sp. A-GB7]|uniref:PPOX class F420-dependent oxidoreductase n=1 Tax=Natronococcus sp. A-GB7 TaxID=3037649 RepID=UPI00241C0240|nr:PPOX class F420-dependent oxidoreductase [Natronococcus sp. A-GB7]MDG5817734.1 PPOX class F420-dependent oxidoreductase [Natronococcus sp. A-GB7]
MVPIPEEYHDLFEKPTFAHVGTLTADGAPHITPVWIDYDPEAERLLVNTERGRQKERNVRANPAVGVSMTDPDDPYRYLSVVGEVEELRTEGARAHIDELSRRYLNVEEYPNPVETERVVMVVRAERVL